METYKNYVGGEWVDAVEGDTMVDHNPSDARAPIGELPASTQKDVDNALAAAVDAFSAWSKTPAPARGAFLFRAADLLRERLDSIAELLSLEEGKPLPDAKGEVGNAANLLEYFGGLGARMSGETVESGRPNVDLFTIREPIGPVGLVTPWNFPINLPAVKAAPALVAGNTVVMKPATNAAAATLALIGVLADAGIPAGVLNAVVGVGSTVGSHLVNADALAAVSFTGSTANGTDVYSRVTSRGARCLCEMGGKNPLVILKDAPPELATNLAIDGAFQMSGQKCTATSRVIIERSVADEMTDRIAARASELVVGHPLEEGVFLGPVVDETQCTTILEFIEIGKKEGAELLAGGTRLTEGDLEHGWFVAPTVFASADPDMTIAQEEIFGPVLTILVADDYDDAIRIANGTRFGLTASVCTTDLGKAHQFIRDVEFGVAGVNLPTAGLEYHVPFGGTGESGTTFKEQGTVAIDFFTHMKTAAIRYGGWEG